MLGVATVLAFVFAEILAGLVLHLFGAPVQVVGDLGLGEVLTFTAVKLTSAVAAVLVVLSGASTWRRIGASLSGASFRAGWWWLAPVGLLVILPPAAAALASGDPLFDRDLTPTLAIALVALAIAVSLSEELWFRGLVIDALESARQPWLTIIASAVLFGLPHLPLAGGNTAAIANAIAVTLAVGIPFTVVRLRCGSIWPLVAWHAVIDSWAFLHTAAVTPEGSPDVGDVAATLVLPSLVALGYLWWFQRSRLGAD